MLSPQQQIVTISEQQQSVEVVEVTDVPRDDRIPEAARSKNPAIFSLKGVSKEMHYVPPTGDIRNVHQLMDMWDNGPPSTIAAIAAGAARMPLSHLAQMTGSLFRCGSKDTEYQRVRYQIAPGKLNDCWGLRIQLTCWSALM